MKRFLPIRHSVAAAGLLLAGAAGLCAQMQPTGAAKPSAAESTLPASQPTSAAGQTGTAPPAPAAQQHVEVDYNGGLLTVQATNASLNEILREVGQKTGMKITGGVADDRVFGSYGPSTPALVLDALLDGTESNVLLVNDANGGSELILTPRHGGASPPNPSAAKQTNEADETSGGGYVPPVRPYQPPGSNGRGPGSGAPEFPGSAPGSAPGTGTDASGAGTKTPQEIYEQLQQTMQQQKHLNAPLQ